MRSRVFGMVKLRLLLLFLFLNDYLGSPSRYSRVPLPVFHNERKTYISFIPLPISFFKRFFRIRRTSDGHNAFKAHCKIQYGSV